MKAKIIFTCLLITANWCFGQVSISVKNNCYNAKKVLQFELEVKNTFKKDLVLSVEANNKVMQLPLPKKDNQLNLSVKSTFPITFIVFYKNDTIIDDYVVRTDHPLPFAENIIIPSDSFYCRKYQNAFIGNETREKLKEQQELYFECYLVYSEDGNMHYVKTAKTKVKYDCD